ncbi:MAG: hypothetical protein UT05_C0008G0050 [Parcubacteria group bacterium GW2011_GWF2_38_76]|nr:MAG: hypothetical protein UT05_C0008G0050 [Parcubacteria group bacterium GW2011_GWF2_38_76]HBM45695.1 hypothetical protein [Patescibacteria group bacterium]
MLKNYKDVAKIILGVLIFFIVFIVAERGGVRDGVIGFEALLSSGIADDGKLSSKNNFHDFGIVFMHEGNKTHSFNIENNGKNDIKIKNIYTTSLSLEVYLENEEKKIGPFDIRNYLYKNDNLIIIRKGGRMIVELIYSPSRQGLLGVGLSEPFAVIEDEFGSKIYLRISALVFP